MEVALLESTPDPEEVACRAARNDYMTEWVVDKSFDEVMESVDGDTIDDKKETLIHHLMRRGHYGPFEHPQATFSVKSMSRVCMAQITRHRHASFDVQSLRYTVPGRGDIDDPEDVEEYVVVPPSVTAEEWKSRETGMVEFDVPPDERKHRFLETCYDDFETYFDLIDDGVPAEDARFVLPQATKVNVVFSINARGLMHIFDMRAAGDAQWEVREMSEEILELAKDWMPTTFSFYESEMKDRKNRLGP
ncbi:FAD-dependent thymidylate synthase [Halorutilales archaeon Cl-col2-1]